jgi:LmbE family N-acetylglucosaminyl deacetylase
VQVIDIFLEKICLCLKKYVPLQHKIIFIMKTIQITLFAIVVFFLHSTPMLAVERWLEGYNKVLVIGAHPDDPETMCGGTMIKLREMGVEVVSVYFTSGEAGILGKSPEESSMIRVAEAKKACEVMGVRAVFMTQVDGNSEVNKARYAEMKSLIEAEKPDMVITHWPIDSHRDHRVCSILVYDAWRQTGYNFDLFYGEVMTGLQTQTFAPNHWVDITEQHAQKVKAYYCHDSQDMPVVQEWHDAMEVLRGMECHAKYAEAFTKQVWKE